MKVDEGMSFIYALILKYKYIMLTFLKKMKFYAKKINQQFQDLTQKIIYGKSWFILNKYNLQKEMKIVIKHYFS